MQKKLQHEFVEFIPETLNELTLYISVDYKTVTHKCFCGCGQEVITPLAPFNWTLIFNGESVSLYPSIGSWSLPCQSHYWIKESTIIWAKKWTKEQIKKGRERDRKLKQQYYREATDGMPESDDIIDIKANWSDILKRSFNWLFRR